MHGTIPDALVWPLVVEVGLKFNQRLPQRRFTGEEADMSSMKLVDE